MRIINAPVAMHLLPLFSAQHVKRLVLRRPPVVVVQQRRPARRRRRRRGEPRPSGERPARGAERGAARSAHAATQREPAASAPASGPCPCPSMRRPRRSRRMGGAGARHHCGGRPHPRFRGGRQAARAVRICGRGLEPRPRSGRGGLLQRAPARPDVVHALTQYGLQLTYGSVR